MARSYRLILTLAAVLVVGILAVRVVRGDPTDETPGCTPPGTAIIDEQTAAANDARTNAAEQSDQQDQQDWQNGLRGLLPSKDGSGYVPSSSPADPTPQTGIVDRPVLPNGLGRIYHITNGWGGVVNGHTLGLIVG